MSEDREREGRVTIRMTHGTARRTTSVPAVPPAKTDKEVFWCHQLVECLGLGAGVSVTPNFDDSDGRPDVLVGAPGSEPIAIQVTELTSSVRRRRESIRSRYLERVTSALLERGVKSSPPVVAKLLSAAQDPEKPLPPETLVSIIEHEVAAGPGPRQVTTPGGVLMLMPVEADRPYVPTANGIAVDIDFDQVPRTLATYREAAEYLADRKVTSLADWLLIWSTDLWRDRDWIGDIVEQMRVAFVDHPFQRVYLLESIDEAELSHAWLGLHEVIMRAQEPRRGRTSGCS